MDKAWLWLILPLCGVMSGISSGLAMVLFAKLFRIDKMTMKEGCIFSVGFGACLIWSYTVTLLPLGILIPNPGPGLAPNPVPFFIFWSLFALPIVLARVFKAYEERLSASAMRALLLALIQMGVFALLAWWSCSAVLEYYYSVLPPIIPLPGLPRG